MAYEALSVHRPCRLFKKMELTCLLPGPFCYDFLMTFDQFLKEGCPLLDLNWRKFRRRSARRGVCRRIGELELSGYQDYLLRLREDEEEAERLPEIMRVTVSRFFRERERWEILANRVLPVLLERIGTGEGLRVWSAGCCGGEEPYSLALLWLERLRQEYPGRKISILATDIDESELARARDAVYDRSSLKEAPDTILRSRFRSEGDRLRLAEEAISLVRFKRHDLMRDPLPDRMDLVLCRYLPFTYYREDRQLLASFRLNQALSPGGALMIGGKEEIGRGREVFRPWPGAPGVFQPLK